MYNLTETQKENLKWIVQQVRSGNLSEDFYIFHTMDGKTHVNGRESRKIEDTPYISIGSMRALDTSNLVIFKETKEENHTELHCTLLGNAYKAVDSNFGEKVEVNSSSYLNSAFGEPDPNYVYDLVVLMPFEPKLKPIYDDHIKRVANELHLSVARADEFFSQKSVMSEIWSIIALTSIVIADCTNKNPNVFYEIGIAHAIGKPVILITQNSDDVPFDLKHIRYIQYDYTPRGMEKFETDLYKTISDTLKKFNSEIKLIQTKQILDSKESLSSTNPRFLVTSPTQNELFHDNQEIEAYGKTSLPKDSLIWTILRDKYNHLYLQNPPVEIEPGNNRWISRNIHLGKGIIEVIFVKVTDEGNEVFEKKVANEEWGHFDSLPMGSETLEKVQIRVD